MYFILRLLPFTESFCVGDARVQSSEVTQYMPSLDTYLLSNPQSQIQLRLLLAQSMLAISIRIQRVINNSSPAFLRAFAGGNRNPEASLQAWVSLFAHFAFADQSPWSHAHPPSPSIHAISPRASFFLRVAKAFCLDFPLGSHISCPFSLCQPSPHSSLISRALLFPPSPQASPLCLPSSDACQGSLAYRS